MSSNRRHKPPDPLTPQERRWLAQAAKKRGVVYQPWPEHAERAKREELVIFRACEAEGCKILIRATGRDKYCARCKAAEHDRKSAARNRVRKQKYKVTTSAAENERAREAARRKRERERKAA